MVTAGVLVTLLGVCMLITSVTALALKMGSNRARRLVEATAIAPISTLRAGARRVAVLGTIGFGPTGPIRAPVSEVECAWYRIQLVRSPSRSKDESPPPEDVLYTYAAPAPPALSDSSGTVLVDPAFLVSAPNLDDPVATELTYRVLGSDPTGRIESLVPRKFLDDTRRSETLQLWEIRLAAGRQVYALGSTRQQNGSVILAPAKHERFTVFTTDEQSTVVARRRANAADQRALAVFLGRFGAVLAVAGGLILLLAL
jgi:hypothetical protein